MLGVARGATLLLCSRVAGLVMGIGVFTLLTRGLSPTRFGVLATVLSITQMATTPFDYSLETVHTREALRRPGIEAAILRWSGRVRLVLGLVLACVLALAGPVLIGSDHEATLVIALAVLPIGSLFAANPVLVRQRALANIAVLGLVQSAMWLVAVAVLTAAEAPLTVFAVAYVVSVAAQGLVIRFVARRRRHAGAYEPLDLRAFLRLMRPGAALAVISIAVVVYLKIDTVLLFRLRGPEEAGDYALAFRFLEQASIVPLTLHNVFSPRVLKSLPGSHELGQAFGEYIRMALLISTPLVVVGLLLAEPFVRTVFGERYLDAVPLLRTMLPAFVLICLGYVMTAVAVSAGRTSRQVVIALTALVVNVTLNLWLIPVHGASAAAALTVVTEVVVVVGLFVAIRSVSGVAFPWAWSGRLAVVLAAAAAGGALAPSPLVGALCFALSYAALSLAAGLVSLRELRAGRLFPGLVSG